MRSIPAFLEITVGVGRAHPDEIFGQAAMLTDPAANIGLISMA
jgi:hypothetical protein